MSAEPHANAPLPSRPLVVETLTQEAFAAFGTVVPPMEDGTEFGPWDAQLDLSKGTPRFYNMRVPARGLTVKQITRHRLVTQTLASAGGHDWFMAVAAPGDLDNPDAAPALDAIRAFRIPGDVAVTLHTGTWHAGPMFEGADQCFFNLELADTNVVDHHTARLGEIYGVVLKLVEPA